MTQPPGVRWVNRGRLPYPLWAARALSREIPREERKDYSKAAARENKNIREKVSQFANAGPRFFGD
jgi:hypothetical protein